MQDAPDTVRIQVPGQREPLAPPTPGRLRAFKRHLIETMRDLAAARRPDRLVQRRAAEPEGFLAHGVGVACAHCAGSCCMAGGTHAFIDERTLARVRAERPGLGARAILSAYVAAVAPLAYRGSCLFHGAQGCTLDRGLRAELCNAYYCTDLLEFLKTRPDPGHALTITTHAGEVRTIEP